MNIFESLENLNVSEECFNDIVQLVKYFVNEEELDMEKAYNSGRRHYKTQIKKLPGKIKAAIRDFNDARSKVFNAEQQVRDNFKSPEGEEAHKIFKQIKNKNYKDEDEKRALINKHRELQNQEESKLKPEIEKVTKPLIADRKQKREKMSKLRSKDTKNNLYDKLNYYIDKVYQVRDNKG